MAAKWLRLMTFVLIAALLTAAWLFAKPHEAKPKPPDDRLQWSAKAMTYTPAAGASLSPSPPLSPNLTEAAKLLVVPPDALDASLQISLRLKPRGDSGAPAVNPNGSGTLTVGGRKYSFLIDSTSMLERYTLSDGSLYVRGPLSVIIDTPQGAGQATLAVSSMLGSDEGLWTYPNPDGRGTVSFGSGFTKAHAEQIAALR